MPPFDARRIKTHRARLLSRSTSQPDRAFDAIAAALE
jgi:hypothetical protein